MRLGPAVPDDAAPTCKACGRRRKIKTGEDVRSPGENAFSPVFCIFLQESTYLQRLLPGSIRTFQVKFAHSCD